MVPPIYEHILELERKSPDRYVAVLVPELVERRWLYYLRTASAQPRSRSSSTAKATAASTSSMFSGISPPEKAVSTAQSPGCLLPVDRVSADKNHGEDHGHHPEAN